jgi:hypothetical protein
MAPFRYMTEKLKLGLTHTDQNPTKICAAPLPHASEAILGPGGGLAWPSERNEPDANAERTNSGRHDQTTMAEQINQRSVCD